MESTGVLGVLLFDIFIGNSDRHNGNIKVDDKGKPTRLFVFDHDQALFGVDPAPGAAIKRLSSLSTRLGVSCGKVSRGNRHCLLDVVSSTEYFGE